MATLLLSETRTVLTVLQIPSYSIFSEDDEPEATDLCDTCMCVKPASQVSHTDALGSTVCDECAEDANDQEVA